MTKATCAARGHRLIATSVAVLAGALALLSVGGGPAFAAGEAHPLRSSFGSFVKPSGIAVDEATGDVYVADIESQTVSKFDASGNPVDFESLGVNKLTGADTPQKAFLFPQKEGTPAALSVDNACVERTPALTGSACREFDPSAGDLYVLDSGANVVYKFSSSGEYLGRISAPFPKYRLLGMGVDAKGLLRVHVDDPAIGEGPAAKVDVFGNGEENAYIVGLTLEIFPQESEPFGAAIAPNGDMYLKEINCACVRKWGGGADALGYLDGGAGDIAAAVDSVTGHVYVDEQSSIAEWDSGAMNGPLLSEEVPMASGAAVVTFGGLSLAGNSSGQGGLAVNGQTGEIYVSSPVDGKVYVFGTSVPRVGSEPAGEVTQTTATLHGVVVPGGEAATSCRFEYETVPYYVQDFEVLELTKPVTAYHHSVPCEQSAAQIGSGDSPVPVSAQASELQAGRLHDVRLVVENAQGSSFADERLGAEGAGFGFKAFSIQMLEKNGTPDTQGGSHPYQMRNTIIFNTKAVKREKNADARYVTEPDGSPRDIVVDLPPGLVGDPNATAKKCVVAELEKVKCPEESEVGELFIKFAGESTVLPPAISGKMYNMVPPRGTAVQLGANFIAPDVYINNRVPAGGNYAVEATSPNITQLAPLIEARLAVRGVVGKGTARKPFLTLPTGCNGPLKSKASADSYQDPGHFVEATSLSVDSSGEPVPLTGCSKLRMPASVTVAPDTSNASTASGLTVGVHIPQQAAFDPDGLAESSLRNTTAVLPAGVAINPSGGDGLEACTSDANGLSSGSLGSPADQIGYLGDKKLNPEYEPTTETNTFTSELPSPLRPGANFCPNGSKIGTVKISTPLLDHELEGAVYLAAQNANPFGGLIAMYLVAEDAYSGTLIKLAGEVSLTDTGQIVTTFKNTPDLPFETLELHLFGGERGPLTTPSRCGSYTTKAVFTPWDGNGPVTSESTFSIEHGPHGGPCPGASLPFNPSLNAGTTSNNAGNYSSFSTTIERQDGEQNMQSVTLHMPSGLSGRLTGVKLCPEAQANEGTCGPESLIGETTVAAGVGPDPVSVKGGKVYLTEKYNGAPFGLSIVNPVKAGPFDLERDSAKPTTNMPACDCLVVRAKVEVDPVTAALTVTTDPSGPHVIPHLIDGVPVQIQKVNVLINREHFMFNPTSCEQLKIEGSIASDEGASAPVSDSFQGANCANLGFKPSFKVSTSGKTSRKNGASLHVKLSYPNAAAGTQTNIHSVHVELPKALPSRLSTLNHACVDSVFSQNPAKCPSQSRVGVAKAVTPVLPVPLEGPAYFVSHGGQKFPELVVVLQGYGVTVDLAGETFISKAGITSSTFRTVPDVPVGSFELTLPEGEFSALAANRDLCTSSLRMPTTFTAQNGATLSQNNAIEVTGCTYALRILHSQVHKRTLTVQVSVPAAGKLTATGNGVSPAGKTAKDRQTLTLTLKERSSGKLRAKIQLRFTPAKGKQRQVLRKALTATFR